MKYYVTLVLVICACAAAVFALFGDDGFSRMRALRKSVEAQREKNLQLQAQVSALKSKVHGLRNDDRALEKAARNQLGMARPDERIFIFEKESAVSFPGE